MISHTKKDILFKVRSADQNDLEQVLEIAVDFFYESDNRAGGLDADLYRFRVLQALQDITYDTIIVMDGDRIAGYSVITWVRDFTLKRIGEMIHFYVRPEYRGKGVSQLLRDRMIERWEDWGCWRIFVEAASGVNNSAKLFSNLWKKVGFKETGIILVRDNG